MMMLDIARTHAVFPDFTKMWLTANIRNNILIFIHHECVSLFHTQKAARNEVASTLFPLCIVRASPASRGTFVRIRLFRIQSHVMVMTSH